VTDCTSLSNLCKKSLEFACTEPPFTMSMTEEQLQSLLLEPLTVDLSLTTVSVGKAIKKVTRASMAALNSLVWREMKLFIRL